MALIFDIECDGLLDQATKLHSLCILNTETGELISCTDNSQNYKPITYGLELLSKADLIIGHNIICFDIPVIQKIYPDWEYAGKVRDTLTISRLIWTNLFEVDCGRSRSKNKSYRLPPNLYGRHSLESWGYRLGEYKGSFGKGSDWQAWSPEMQSYCEQDVHVTHWLWKTIQKKDYSEQAISLETRFQQIIFRQEQNGFPFDERKAQELYIEICAERDALRQELQELYPPVDKGCWFTPKRDNKTKGYVAGVQVWKPKITAFNPTSRDDIIARFIEVHGWKPSDFTDRGKPKIDDEILSELPWPEAQKLARLFLLQKRAAQLGEGTQAWMKAVKDGRIHGGVTTNGAVTGRCTHHHPNIAQVPAVGVPFGEECRALFYAPEGWSMVGCDASGLELRCLAHYMAKYDGGKYADIILHGDIHTENQKAAGLETRALAKRFIYAFLYGAGALKIGQIAGLTEAEREKYKKSSKFKQTAERLKNNNLNHDDETVCYVLKGSDLKNTFLKQIPALKNLVESVQAKVKERPYLKGLDGRLLHVRSAHSALNVLLQSAGALVVKKATCIFWDLLDVNGLLQHVQQVAHVHDEFQLLVREGFEQQVGELAVLSFQEAGEYFKFRCPLDGEFKVGRNWAETH